MDKKTQAFVSVAIVLAGVLVSFFMVSTFVKILNNPINVSALSRPAAKPVAEAEEDPEPVREPKVEEADHERSASLECLPLDERLTPELLSSVGPWTKAVQVEAGEGLKAGHRWWVVVFAQEPSDKNPSGLAAFLTDAPGIEERAGSWPDDPAQWMSWISLDPADPWKEIAWDADKIALANCALERAYWGIEEL